MTTTIPNKIQHPTRSRVGGLPNTTTGAITSSNSTGSIGSSSTTTSTTTSNIPTPTNNNTADRLAQIDDLKYFLATATENWEENDDEESNNGITTSSNIKRFRLPTGEDMSCVLWNDLFYITGTDIVRSLTFRFHAFGRPVANAKKFEEGIFSDLRNLKPGNDARLEEPKSELLDMLYKNNCIRTQKKQKVFYWYSVPHDRLFLDALERDLKREKMDMEPTTVAVAEPASSLSLDSTQELFDQLRKSMSLSAAATAHALEDEAARCTASHVQQGIWDWLPHQRNKSAATATASTTVNSNKQSAMTSPIRRSRVNSVPSTATSTTTNGTVCARHHHHHLNHAGRPSPKAPIRPRVRSRATTPIASPVARQRLSSTLEGRHAYASITKPTASSNNKMAGPSQQQQPMGRAPGRRDQPSSPIIASTTTTGARRQSSDSPKSLDSNTLKKKKAIFGALSLFDGSPTYKQRRRRAASTSSGATPMASNSSLVGAARAVTTPTAAAAPSVPVHQHKNTTDSPYAMMRPPHPHQGVIDPSVTSAGITATQQRPSHLHHHQSAPSTLTHYDLNSNNNSRLAMAAAAAAHVGFVSTPGPACQQQHHQHDHCYQQQESTSIWQSAVTPTETKLEPERTYTCPQPSCGHMFKLLEHLDQHLRAHELEQPFMCPLCGKRFTHSEFLMEHQSINHQEMFDSASVVNINDCACSTSSPEMASPWQQTAEAAVAAAAAAIYTPATTITPSPPLTAPGQYHGSSSDGTSNGDSRCSTLSPMLDLDHFYESTVTATATGLQFRSRTNSSTEDDSASSLTSSPASAIHLNQQTQQQYFPHYHHPQFINDVSDTMTPFMFNAGDHSFAHPPVTLFSSFKPELFQQQQQQQQFFSASSPPDNVGSFPYDGGFQQHDHQYTPFVVPTDVSMTMM
ncbi:hypothetical protein INT45_007502 [Circinella minor]|uniref:C2H2-type domain-containing protein n=1 Tax=Circinella minor TaxID=1195481 RepID=A0A8H7SFW6_9FUNG|nr:hypothetical protein INT45_007502 [Circinella minor]